MVHYLIYNFNFICIYILFKNGFNQTWIHKTKINKLKITATCSKRLSISRSKHQEIHCNHNHIHLWFQNQVNGLKSIPFKMLMSKIIRLKNKVYNFFLILSMLLNKLKR